MKTYNTIVTSKEVEVLANVVARCPYECIELDPGKYGFMDNGNGDIRNYFCDTLGYECSNYEAFDFEYLEEPKQINYDRLDLCELEKRVKEIGIFNNWKGYSDLYFTRKEIRDIKKLGIDCINLTIKELHEAVLNQISKTTSKRDVSKTHLQGLGDVPAIKAGELKEGDIIVCNYGYTQTVTRIIKETAKSIFVEIRSDESGKLYETRYLKSRLVAIKERKSVTLPELPKEIDITDALDEMKAKEEVKPVKLYNTTFGVGTAKYVVNFHDGIKRHKDGSRFYDIRIFSNKKGMEKFIKELEKEGYKLDTFFNESELEKETKQESDRIAFAKDSKNENLIKKHGKSLQDIIDQTTRLNGYAGINWYWNFKREKQIGDIYSRYVTNIQKLGGLLDPNKKFTRKEYASINLPEIKQEYDIVVESIEGNWYTIRLNREIEIEGKKMYRYDICIAVPESVYNKLKDKYNVMCNF